MDALQHDLRYIEGGRLGTIDDPLNGATVMDPSGDVIGTLTGALIEPARRHVSYLIVESRRWFATKRYAVPFDTARFDHSRKALLMDGKDLQELHGERFMPFSDEDLINAIFAPHAA